MNELTGTIEPLVNHHEGLPAYVFGTGKSLDAFNFAEVGDGVQICLNRTMGVVPILRGRPYWMVLDDAWRLGVPGPWDIWLDELRSHNGVVGVFMNPMYGPDTERTEPPGGPPVIHFRSPRSKHAYELLTRTRGQIGRLNTLFTYAGTGCTAVHLAWLMGAARVVIVGIDGTDGYADRVIQWYDKPKRGGFGYAMSKECTLDTAGRLDIELVDFSEVNNENVQGL